MGWPFKLDKRRKKIYKRNELRKVGNYKPTNFVLIEENGDYHYGFMDAGLVNFPTYGDEMWFAPNLNQYKIKLPSENTIHIIWFQPEGSKNPWADLLGIQIYGPLIFQSEFPFTNVDIEMFQKINSS